MGGDITIPTANPANGETVTLTINGTACVFRFVSSIGSLQVTYSSEVLKQSQSNLAHSSMLQEQLTLIKSPSQVHSLQQWDL